MVTVRQIQRPDCPEAARSSEDTKSATVKRKEKKKRKLAHIHVANASVEMTEMQHAWASPAASQGPSLKQNGNRGWLAFLRAGTGTPKQRMIATCIAKLMKMSVLKKTPTKTVYKCKCFQLWTW